MLANPLSAPAPRPEAGLAPFPPRKRLSSDWTAPEPPPDPANVVKAGPERIEASVEFDWAGEEARIVGTVLHRLLHVLVQRSNEAIDDALRQRLELAARGMLEARGLIGDRLRGALASIHAGLQTILADARGRWILTLDHQEAVAECALSGVVEGRIDHIIVDRSFVDRDGIRWIIDYKLGTHGGGDKDSFLDREQQRYRAQLERYARIYSSMETRPIRLGLYFPLLAGWREWAYSLQTGEL
ncbi:MAG TPA: PD-(D/E)XK nuclease family protein [Gammaproteobacteria bacterium]|nr:PD-(D/E)XK nuclease family protein [Gammaproteobacteria bacterium]